MAVDSRRKGARFEVQVAKKLREAGYEAERGCQHAGGKDSPDVKHNAPRLHIEAKAVEHLNLWKALEQSKKDAGEDEIPIVVFKRNYSGIHVALPWEEFIELYQAWVRELKEKENGENKDTKNNSKHDL